jgi:hypothetical protein
MESLKARIKATPKMREQTENTGLASGAATVNKTIQKFKLKHKRQHIAAFLFC